MIKLRAAQQKLLSDIKAVLLKNIRTILAVAPTGFGKTVCFAYMAISAASKGQRVLIMSHRIRLIRQCYKKILECGQAAGIINSQFTPNKNALIQIASVQTLVKQLDKHDMKYHLVIEDECHHSRASQWMKVKRAVMQANPNAIIVGFTATPARLDGQGLGVTCGGVYEAMVLGPSTKECMDDGWLCTALTYLPPLSEDMDFSRVKRKKNGDYDEKELSALMNTSKVTGDAVAYYKEIAAGWPAVIFCVSVTHAETVCREFNAAGYRFEVVEGRMKEAEIEKIFRRVETRELHGVVAIDLISEGVDIPIVKYMGSLRPTQSTSMLMQQWGRVLRPVYAEGMPLDTREQRLEAIAAGPYPFAIIADHVGNAWAHGEPDWPRYWSLDGEERKSRGQSSKKSVYITQCPQCYVAMIPTIRCKKCGFEFKINSRSIDNVEGELTLLTDQDREKIKRMKAKEVTQARSLEDLIRIEQDRQYKAGWAKNVHAARNKKMVG